MDIIRYATPEEIKELADTSDLTNMTQVVTYGGKDFAVVRSGVIEVDPMYFAKDSPVKRKLLFAMNLETVMRLNNVQQFYFNVPIADEDYRKVLETWGAVPTSREPEIRYKKVL